MDEVTDNRGANKVTIKGPDLGVIRGADAPRSSLKRLSSLLGEVAKSIHRQGWRQPLQASPKSERCPRSSKVQGLKRGKSKPIAGFGFGFVSSSLFLQ